MIRGCAYHGPHDRALDLFAEMTRRGDGLAPDSFTYPYVVDACARLKMWRGAEAVHCRALKEGLDAVPAVGSSLLAFYVASGSLGDARRVLDGFAIKSVGLSNRMVSEYAKARDIKSARELFDAMAERDVLERDAHRIRQGGGPRGSKGAVCENACEEHHIVDDDDQGAI